MGSAGWSIFKVCLQEGQNSGIILRTDNVWWRESKFQPVDFIIWKCVQKRGIKQVQEGWLGFSFSNECKYRADVSQPCGLAAFLQSGSQNSHLCQCVCLWACVHTHGHAYLWEHMWLSVNVDVHNKPLCVCTYTSLCLQLWFSLSGTVVFMSVLSCVSVLFL
jgi:hypothetical protein